MLGGRGSYATDLHRSFSNFPSVSQNESIDLSLPTLAPIRGVQLGLVVGKYIYMNSFCITLLRRVSDLRQLLAPGKGLHFFKGF